ncbi:alpha/beta hydrolase [Streptomyces showdoensis]|uniref:Esterase n=1 Tax=Streptomyces showdoensis TaxID=68268 RepID=A0A2P2GC49_STREW|nr:alpha/beta fold hydrolase [Streptomyces showdoensis]KKZ68997.1 esterase [Streptomyces showdoensis]
MTAFVLVSGPFTGGWVWREVAGRLRAAGAEALPLSLTGMGDGPAGGPETDLETHVADVVRAVDACGAAEVVLVGHDYGIHPVLGAADRRPGRVARVVYLDSGMPGDGDAALALAPEGTVARDGFVAPPSGEGWARWGSLDGIPAEALDRLDRLAVPQPERTLTQPLRLAGAPFDRPTTGVLCTANGSGIAMVEMLVASGPPAFRVLADPRVGFLELATGHWPMLSAPGDLAEALLRAAADEGHRVEAPEHEAWPAHAGAFLLDVPERPRDRRGRVDLHLPEAEGPRPAVLFVHGGPVPPDRRPTPRDSPTLLGYARYVAGLGAVGATLDHRLHDLADYPRAAEDLAEAVDLVRADPRVDGDRIALWFLSAGGLLSADWLAAPPPWLRAVALSYPVLAPPSTWRAVHPRFRPVGAVAAASPPIVLSRAGLEHEVFATAVEEFLVAAGEAGAELDLVEVPLARHGFETLDHTEETRAAVARATRAVLGRLLPTAD